MKKKGIYALCTVFLTLLVLCAYFAPDLIVKWNDASLMDTWILTTRESFEYSTVNDAYETDLQKRLSHFAAGLEAGKQYYVTKSKMDPERYEEVLKEILYRFEEADLFFFLFIDMGMFPVDSAIFQLENIVHWDYYVIYDDSFSEGASFLCHDLKFVTGSGSVEILVDASDYTFYHMDVNPNENWSISDLYEEKFLKFFGIQADELINWMSDYYQGTLAMAEEEEKTNQQSLNKQTVVATFEENSISSDELVLELPLSYEGGTLHLEIDFMEPLYEGSKSGRIGTGIVELAELIRSYVE